MKRRKWTSRAICGALALVATVGAAIAAGSQGSQSNPLVTLSYLNEKFLPDLLDKVDEKVEVKAGEIKAELGEIPAPAFVSTEVEKGKTLTVNAGTQLLLRSGAANCVDGLVDLTAGETSGGALQGNHLYLATGDAQRVTVSEKALFLVMGGHAVN